MYNQYFLFSITYVLVTRDTNNGIARKGIQVYKFHNFQLWEWYNSSRLHQQNFQNLLWSCIRTVKLVWTFQYILSDHGYMSSILDLLSTHNLVEHKRATSNRLFFLSWHPRHLCFQSQACHITRQYRDLQNHPVTKKNLCYVWKSNFMNKNMNNLLEKNLSWFFLNFITFVNKTVVMANLYSIFGYHLRKQQQIVSLPIT